MLQYSELLSSQPRDETKQAMADGASWTTFAACGPDDDVFFAPDEPSFEYASHRREREAAAQLICASCEVRDPCLEEAIRQGEYSTVRGGIGTSQLKALIARKQNLG
jgi:hypothetical protein